MTQSGKLSETEFCIAMHLVASAMKGVEIPSALPLELKNLSLLRQVHIFLKYKNSPCSLETPTRS
jgi:hypothetical protein